MHVMFITRGFSPIQLGVQNYRNTPGRGSKKPSLSSWNNNNTVMLNYMIDA